MAAGKGIVAELRRASCGWFVNISAFGNSLPRLYGLTFRASPFSSLQELHTLHTLRP